MEETSMITNLLLKSLLRTCEKNGKDDGDDWFLTIGHKDNEYCVAIEAVDPIDNGTFTDNYRAPTILGALWKAWKGQ